MSPANPFGDLALGEWLETFLPDFVLAFTFFTALTYAALAKRFDRQRPAIAISASLGLALAIGLVWWEQQEGLSIRDLGPVAVGLFILVLAAVMYHAIRQVAGSVAGLGIALGVALLVSAMLNLDWWLTPETVRPLITVALVVGILALLVRTRWVLPTASASRSSSPSYRRDLRDLGRAERTARRTSDSLGRRLRGLRRESEFLRVDPELARQVAVQIRQILPAEGWLTERLAELRKKAYRVRNGHVARLKETREAFAELPISAKKQASAALVAGYGQLAGIDERLERLNRSAAACEKRIRELTAEAERAADKEDHRRLAEILKRAERLQRHNSKLFSAIDRTEAKLSAVAGKVARQAKQVNDA